MSSGLRLRGEAVSIATAVRSACSASPMSRHFKACVCCPSTRLALSALRPQQQKECLLQSRCARSAKCADCDTKGMFMFFSTAETHLIADPHARRIASGRLTRKDHGSSLCPCAPADQVEREVRLRAINQSHHSLIRMREAVLAARVSHSLSLQRSVLRTSVLPLPSPSRS